MSIKKPAAVQLQKNDAYKMIFMCFTVLLGSCCVESFFGNIFSKFCVLVPNFHTKGRREIKEACGDMKYPSLPTLKIPPNVKQTF